MNILILGSGGREHTFAWKLGQSALVDKVFVCPGNAGTSQIATNLPGNPTQFELIKSYVLENQIELVVVGPEEPLVKGVVDFFKSDADLTQVPIIGPSALGAQLEGSKDFSKAFMQRHGIPTASSATFEAHQLAEGLAYLAAQPGPYVLKADGLAAGKGVIITEDVVEAQAQLTSMLQDRKFGAASEKVLIEQFLKGIELSVFVLTDGKNYILLPEAKDYKRIGEQDQGLNTGGMGAVSPVPFADAAFMKRVEEEVVIPTVRGLQSENIPYCGFIFIGLMNDQGTPYVIEYNVRMGDPETEVVLPRIESDLVEVLQAAALGKLNEVQLQVSSKTAMTTVVVAGGYPEAYQKGDVMTFPAPIEDTILFHAGTAEQNGQIVTNGGRVVAATGLGNSLEEAREKSQFAATQIDFRGKYFRRDIGLDLLNH
ncbi:MAG: phosphoribosylamine--glycine ligase [Spirosomataceae bacterium]